VAAYGIDYRICEEVNNQYRYPLFMVTSTTKNLDSVSVECMQLHHLENSNPVEWNELNDLFPDADTIVITPAPEEPQQEYGESVYAKDAYVDFTPNNPSVPSGHITINIPTDGGLSLNESSFESGDFPYNFTSLPSDFFENGFFEENAEIKVALLGAEDTVFTNYRITSLLSNYELVASLISENESDWWAEGTSVVITRIDTTLAYPQGDVNLDGGLNILDIVAMVNYIMGNSELNEQQFANADMNNDGNINILDILQLQNAILED
jgi:hypothetical protein